MILKKYFAAFASLTLLVIVNAGKNSDERPDIARVGKTKRAKMGKFSAYFV